MLVDKAVNKVAGKLRFPGLLIMVCIVFVVDLFVPDMVPFVDEILLGLAALLLSRWRKEPAESENNAED